MAPPALEGNDTMRRVWFLVLAVFAVSVVGFDDVAVGSDERHSGGRHHTGPPDTFVTDWDAIGTQAFSAAALTPAEGHTIFAYVAIAVYDSVMAIEGGYEPFAVEVDAPRRASSEAAVAAAAHGILVHYLPAQAATIIDPAYAASLAPIPDGRAEDRRHRHRGGRRRSAHRAAGRRRLPGMR